MRNKVMNELKQAYQQAMERADGPMNTLNWESKEEYGDWMAQMYYFLCHATRLLCASGARLTMKDDAIHMRMIDHCQQEKTHERMAIRDLAALGYKFTDFPEYPATATVYQSQYYLIDYMDPCALFGCILYLEGLSLHAGKTAYQRVKKAHGDKASLFLRTHTQEDEDHIDQAFAIIGECNEEQLKAALWSLKICDFAYFEMLNEILRNARSQTLQKAA